MDDTVGMSGISNVHCLFTVLYCKTCKESERASE